MLDHASLITLLGLTVIGTPVALVCLLGLTSLWGPPLNETRTGLACQGAIIVGLLAAAAVLVLMLHYGSRQEAIQVAEWVAIPGYRFWVKLVFDRLSIPFAILSFLLCGTIAAFATRYMHRERGFNRFFVLYALFLLGMVLTSLAGTIETLFTGWELVGLASALLVAYFHDRPAPVRNGLWVWAVYRVSDAALLLAAIVMHHHSGAGDFDQLLGSSPWPAGRANISAGLALTLGLLLLIAAAGKSALVPFSGWLPRAMEGPTPSSAIFYGALSVHLGAFLLLRVSPIIDRSVWLAAIVVLLGLLTALYAYLVGSVQSDIKSALSFASLVQVGLIVAEIGLGLRYVALVHLLGNACLRTLQFIRAPTLLHDYHLLENAIGEHLPDRKTLLGRVVPGWLVAWLYRFCLERGYLDVILTEFVVVPLLSVFSRLDAAEQRWTDWLAGRTAARREEVKQSLVQVEELP